MVRSAFKSRFARFIHAPLTESLLILLILLSAILVFLEAVLDPQAKAYHWVWITQNILTGVFIVELAARYSIARKKYRFFRNYWLDIVAVAPFLHAFRILRILRVLRLLRAGILLTRNLNRISSTLAASIGAQIGIFIIVGLIILVGALGVYLLEGTHNQAFASLKDSLWWSFFTLVSGEPFSGEPQTDAGRAITLMVMMGGLTLFAVFTGVVTAVMMQRLKSVMELKALEIDELQNHIVICGWNREGHRIIEELLADPSMRRFAIVVVAEFTETPEQELRHLNLSQLYFYNGDYTTIDVLESIGIYYTSRVILLADATRPRSDQDRDARTVLAALTIEKLNSAIYTCAQLLDRKNDVQLRAAGVDDVIVAAELASHLIATSTRNQGSVEFLTELLTVQTGNQIYKIAVPEFWVERSFWEISQRLKQQFDTLLIAVEQKLDGDRQTLVNPAKETKLQSEDQLIVIARSIPKL